MCSYVLRTRCSLTDFQAWYAASHAMARCARELSRKLWRPIIHAEGIPFDVLCALIDQFNTWRSEYLDKVGVPGSQVNWDFLAAVAACKTCSLHTHTSTILDLTLEGIDVVRRARRNIPCDVGYFISGITGVWVAGDQADGTVRE